MDERTTGAAGAGKKPKKRRALWILAALVLVPLALVVLILATAERDISRELLRDRQITVLEYMNTMGEPYGITFSKVTFLHRSSSPKVFAYSPDGASVSERSRLDLLVAIDDDLGYTGQLHLASGEDLELTRSVFSELVVKTGGHMLYLYDQRSKTGYAELRDDYTGVLKVKYRDVSQVSHSGGGDSSGRVCPQCNGTGRVVLHYGNRWNKIEGYGYGDVCGRCGGTGYLDD